MASSTSPMSWILDPASWTQDPASGIQDPGSGILDSGSSVHEDRTPSVQEVRRMLNRMKKPVDENDQRAVNPNVIVNALGRTCIVAEGNGATLLLKHVQNTLQDNLDMQTTIFEIYDRTGILLRSDQDLRDAVQAGRMPLHGTCDSRFASEIESMCRKVGALKCELDSQKEEFMVEMNHIRQELALSVESAKKERDSEVELANKTEIAELKCDLDSQKEQFRVEMNHLRHELSLSVEYAKKELHSEVEFAKKAESAELKCELESQKENFRVQMNHLRHELTLSVESAKKDVHSEVEFAKQKEAAELQHLETKCFAQMVQASQASHTNVELASKDQLRQLQDDLQSVSTHLKDDVESVSQRVSEMAASVQKSVTGCTMCLSQHTEMLQNYTSLTNQSNVFHARLANVEQSVHNSFLEQLKKDADLIPESIRESGESTSSPPEAQTIQAWPGRLQSWQNSRQELLDAVSRGPLKITSLREPREATPRCLSPGASCASLRRGNGIRSQSLDMPHPFMSSSIRVSARSWSPRRDRLDARLPLTIVESPSSHATLDCNPSNATVRTASPSSTEAESLELDSSRSSTPERRSGTLINTPRSSLHSLPSQAELIRMEEECSQSESGEPEDMNTPCMVSYSSMVSVSASHLSAGPWPRVPSGEDEVSFQSPRLPFHPTSRAPCVRSGAMSPRPPAWQSTLVQSTSSDVASSLASIRGPSSISTGAVNSVPQVTKQLQARFESTKPEAQVVTPRGVSSRVNVAFRSSQPDAPPVACIPKPESAGCTLCLASSQRTVGNPGQIRAQRMMGLSK